MRQLDGKVAMVTGAARRIGRHLALTLAEHGFHVAITYRGSEQEAAITVADLKALGVRASAVQCDVRDPQSVETAVRAAVSEYGRLDVLVNNAGIYETAALEQI